MSPSKPVSRPRTRPRTHPSMSDVALALAARQNRSERSCTIKIGNDNAKGETRWSLELTDIDPEYVGKTALAMADVLEAEYPQSKNGGAS